MLSWQHCLLTPCNCLLVNVHVPLPPFNLFLSLSQSLPPPSSPSLPLSFPGVAILQARVVIVSPIFTQFLECVWQVWCSIRLPSSSTSTSSSLYMSTSTHANLALSLGTARRRGQSKSETTSHRQHRSSARTQCTLLVASRCSC